MIRYKLIIPAILLGTLFILATPYAAFSAPNNEVKKAGAIYMREASELVKKNNCESLNLAKQMVEAYQELRSKHPNELIDQSDALAEISGLIKRYCTAATSGGPAIVYTSAPIATGTSGGVRCTKCTEVPGADVSFVESPEGIVVLPCAGCPQIDLVNLAVIYMGDKERADFLNKVNPTVRNKFLEFEKSNPATVQKVRESFLTEHPASGSVEIIGNPQVGAPSSGPATQPQLPGNDPSRILTTPGSLTIPSNRTIHSSGRP